MIRTVLAAFSLFLSFLSLTSFAAPIRIGQAIDLSGPNAALGRDYVAGIKTYFDMINAAGGINGRQISYTVRDDQGEPEKAAQLVGELIEREQVHYLLGGVGDEAMRQVLASGPFQRSTHTLFAPLAASEANPETVARRRVLFWRPSYLQESRHVLAHFGGLGSRSVAVVTQDAPAARRAHQPFITEAQARGLKLAADVQIGPNGEHVAQQAARIAASRPDFVMVIADTIGTALFLKEYRRHDAQTFVASTSLVNLDTLRELAGPRAVEWTVFSQVVPNPASATSSLQTEHLKTMRQYRDEPVSTLTLEGFAAAKTLVLLLRRAREGESLHDVLARVGTLDLGGLEINPRTGSGLSTYLDIALFRKGSGLAF